MIFSEINCKMAIIGSANIDLSVEVSRIPSLGETVKGLGSQITPGGKGANQAIAASRIGAESWILAKVGDDLFGNTVIQNLQESKVDTTNVKITTKVGTGKAFIVVCGGNNQIILDSGGNDELNEKDVTSVTDNLLNSDGVLIQLEVPLAVVEKTIQICKGKVKIFLNPAPAMPLSGEMLNGIDYFIPNESESKFYTGIDPIDKERIEKSIFLFREMGVRNPLITLGKNGVAFFDGSRAKISESFAINAVDSTAAGDTFAGVFASVISSGFNIEKAVEIGQAAAAITCTRFGAQKAIPNKEEVAAFLEKRKRSSS